MKLPKRYNIVHVGNIRQVVSNIGEDLWKLTCMFCNAPEEVVNHTSSSSFDPSNPQFPADGPQCEEDGQDIIVTFDNGFVVQFSCPGEGQPPVFEAIFSQPPGDSYVPHNTADAFDPDNPAPPSDAPTCDPNSPGQTIASSYSNGYIVTWECQPDGTLGNPQVINCPKIDNSVFHTTTDAFDPNAPAFPADGPTCEEDGQDITVSYPNGYTVIFQCDLGVPMLQAIVEAPPAEVPDTFVVANSTFSFDPNAPAYPPDGPACEHEGQSISVAFANGYIALFECDGAGNATFSQLVETPPAPSDDQYVAFSSAGAYDPLNPGTPPADMPACTVAGQTVAVAYSNGYVETFECDGAGGWGSPQLIESPAATGGPDCCGNIRPWTYQEGSGNDLNSRSTPHTTDLGRAGHSRFSGNGNEATTDTLHQVRIEDDGTGMGSPQLGGQYNALRVDRRIGVNADAAYAPNFSQSSITMGNDAGPAGNPTSWIGRWKADGRMMVEGGTKGTMFGPDGGGYTQWNGNQSWLAALGYRAGSIWHNVGAPAGANQNDPNSTNGIYMVSTDGETLPTDLNTFGISSAAVMHHKNGNGGVTGPWSDAGGLANYVQLRVNGSGTTARWEYMNADGTTGFLTPHPSGVFYDVALDLGIVSPLDAKVGNLVSVPYSSNSITRIGVIGQSGGKRFIFNIDDGSGVLFDADDNVDREATYEGLAEYGKNCQQMAPYARGVIDLTTGSPAENYEANRVLHAAANDRLQEKLEAYHTKGKADVEAYEKAFAKWEKLPEKAREKQPAPAPPSYEPGLKNTYYPRGEASAALQSSFNWNKEFRTEGARLTAADFE